jgi:hypothetical protein
MYRGLITDGTSFRSRSTAAIAYSSDLNATAKKQLCEQCSKNVVQGILRTNRAVNFYRVKSALVDIHLRRRRQAAAKQIQKTSTAKLPEQPSRSRRKDNYYI